MTASKEAVACALRLIPRIPQGSRSKPSLCIAPYRRGNMEHGRPMQSLGLTAQLEAEWRRAGLSFRVMLVGESGTLRLSKAPEQQQHPPYQTRG